MLGTGIVIGVSILLFIATEWFFPIATTDRIAAKQKHFWSIMLTIFSMVLGFTIKGSYDTQQGIENVGSVFRKLSSQEIQTEFQDIFTEYHRYFDHAQPVLKDWAKEALAHFREDMSQGYISLPRELASREIGKVYPYANKSIVATNVGSTRFYFADYNYIQSNQGARGRQVPVIRFYLYSRNQKIVMHDSSEPKNIDEFFQEVKALHQKLGSVYSAVIDVDSANVLPKDLLILDNKFVAETELSQTWEPVRARATEDEKNLKPAREYFRDLVARVNFEKYVVQMTDDDVRRSFHKYEGVTLPAEETLARKVFDDVMHDIGATP